MMSPSAWLKSVITSASGPRPPSRTPNCHAEHEGVRAAVSGEGILTGHPAQSVGAVIADQDVVERGTVYVLDRHQLVAFRGAAAAGAGGKVDRTTASEPP